MRKKNKSIPINRMADEFGGGISIGRLFINYSSSLEQPASKTVENGKGAHRHEGHSFFLLESGTVQLEIDFQKYTVIPPSVIYVHPDQVHKTIISENVTVSSWVITDENLNPEYSRLLEDITPAKPLTLNKETFSILFETVSLCLKFSERKNDKLHRSLLKDICNALVTLVISQYLESEKSTPKLSRFEIVTKAFKELLEHNYTLAKSPAAYAQKLHLSVPYLNECVKNATGHSVSHHIQQRIILEAKRLLYHSGKSVKEIAVELGYDDYPYFSRLFAKITGMTAIAFRSKNLG